MSKANDALQASCEEAKNVCREKLVIIEKGLGKMDTEVRGIDKGMKNTFFKLDNRNLWKTEIDFDSAILDKQAKVLGKLSENDLKDIVLNIGKVLDMMREIASGKPVSTPAPVFAAEVAAMERTGPDVDSMNSEVRNALSNTEDQITTRMDSFEEEEPPINLFDDTEFKTILLPRHMTLTDDFDKKLVSGNITGTADDRDTIKGAGNKIAKTKDVPAFKGEYTKLDNYIESRLPQA